MKHFTSKSQKIGLIGENIACKYLKNKGFFIAERNFTLKCGEIDIVAKRGEVIHFIEVKTMKYKEKNVYMRPEDNIHSRKIRRLAKTCLLYADINNLSDKTEWQIDVLAIELDEVMKKAYIRHLECIY